MVFQRRLPGPFDKIPDEGNESKGYGGVSFLNLKFFIDLRI